MARTLFDKIWDSHVIQDLGDGWALLHIDRHLLHDLSGPPALEAVSKRGLPLHNPELVFSTPDHAVSSASGRTGETYVPGAKLWANLKMRSKAAGVRFFDVGQKEQGIVHVIGPELGIVLPGTTVVCGDSHTCTNGGMGSLAFGIGSSEITQVLATQTLRQQKPKQMRIRFEGTLSPYLSPKDLILHVIGRLGARAADGYAVEYAGSVIRDMSVEGRLTICNLSVELGAKVGMVAPDETTFTYLKGRRFSPPELLFDQAVEYWRTLTSEPDAHFDHEEIFDVNEITPRITWGISPEHVVGIDGTVPDPECASNASQKESWRMALDYMGLQAGQPIAGTKVDWVFIGSCTNSRLSDLREAANVVRGKKVAPGVNAWVVPGSGQVKRDAEMEGLDKVFIEAGLEWREPSCSMCVAANGETIPSGERSVSTSNRNFVGRQGPGARTHLASPATAAAAAISGVIVDPRSV